MNKERRKQIDDIRNNLLDVSPLEEAKSTLEGLRDEEQEYFDNMPEGFQQGDKGQAAEAAVSALEAAIEAIDTMLSSFEDCMNSLEEATQ